MHDMMETVKRRVWCAVERQLALAPAERHPVVQTALTGASWVYAHASSQKRQWQLARRRALPVRTISFGNVTWGGTGKTPCLHHVARMVRSEGHELLLVSRGYGDDEWKMFAAEFPHSLLAIGKHRYANAMARLTGYKREPEATSGQVVALIDDGLQQWGLQKDLEIVMVDCYNPFGNSLLIPAGRLRELPEVALPSADIVVLHHATHLEKEARTQLQTTIQRLARPDTVVAHSHMRLSGLPLGSQLDQHTHERHLLQGESIAPQDNLTVIGLCGIGCPQSFQNTLESAFPGARGVHVHAFPDHHAYSAADLSPIVEAVHEASMSGRSVVVVTTEKDYFRSKALLNAHLPGLRVALCDLEFTHGGDVVKERIRDLLKH